jgi:hypothetical protein
MDITAVVVTFDVGHASHAIVELQNDVAMQELCIASSVSLAFNVDVLLPTDFSPPKHRLLPICANTL